MRPILLCLHGWGGTKESYAELRKALDLAHAEVEIFAPDLPGFGMESEPKKPWTVQDYAEWAVSYVQERFDTQELEHRRLAIVGHSHGGRIAMWLASHNMIQIDHLYLCAPAGIRHPRHFKRIIGLTLAKTGKFFLSIPGLKQLQPLGKKLLYKLVRVHDYEKASILMRETLLNVSKVDFRPLLKDIHVPTDIFWGQDDAMTPVGDAAIMQKAIVGSQLHIYPKVRHAVHRDKAEDIAKVIVATIGKA